MARKEENEDATAPVNPDATAQVAPQQARRPRETRSGGRFRAAARAELSGQSPAVGQRTYVGDSGLVRREGLMVGGGQPARRDRIDTGRTRLREGAMRREVAPLNQERVFNLESGRGANNEPVFDNASIQRGIDQGTIADPQAERERIMGNELEAAAFSTASRPRRLRGGLITPDRAAAEEAIDRSRQDVQNERFSVEAERIRAQNTGLRRASGGTQRDTTAARENLGSTFEETRAVAGLDPETPSGRNRFVNSALDFLEGGGRDRGFDENDLGTLQTVAELAPELDSFLGREPNAGLDFRDVIDGFEQAIISGETDVFPAGEGEAQFKRIPERIRTDANRIIERMQAGSLFSANEKLRANIESGGDDPLAGLTDVEHAVLLREAEAAAEAEASEQPEQRRAPPPPPPGGLRTGRSDREQLSLPTPQPDEVDLLRSYYNTLLQRSQA